MKLIIPAMILISGIYPLSFADDTQNLPNLQEPREQVLTAGQIDEEGMNLIASRGVRVVLNIRPHDEPGARDEAAEAEKLQLKYFYLPVTPSTFTLDKVEEFTRIFQDPENRPILIHCGSGNRVGGMWFAYRVLKEDAEWNAALEEARKIGMKPHLEEIVLPLVNEWKQR